MDAQHEGQPREPLAASEPTLPPAATPTQGPVPEDPTATRWVPLAMGIAGLLLVIGVFLPWATASLRTPSLRLARVAGQLGGTVLGFRTSDGRILLGLGFSLLIVALVAWAAADGRLRVHAATLALATGAIAVVVGIYDLVVRFRVPQAVAGPVRLARDAQRLGFGVSKGAGLWVILVGGVVAVAAAAIDLLSWVHPPSTRNRALVQPSPQVDPPAAPPAAAPPP
jgi:hypothetical protein